MNKNLKKFSIFILIFGNSLIPISLLNVPNITDNKQKNPNQLQTNLFFYENLNVKNKFAKSEEELLEKFKLQIQSNKLKLDRFKDSNKEIVFNNNVSLILNPDSINNFTKYVKENINIKETYWEGRRLKNNENESLKEIKKQIDNYSGSQEKMMIDFNENWNKKILNVKSPDLILKLPYQKKTRKGSGIPTSPGSKGPSGSRIRWIDDSFYFSLKNNDIPINVSRMKNDVIDIAWIDDWKKTFIIEKKMPQWGLDFEWSSKTDNNIFISFLNKNILFEKFFVLNPPDISNKNDSSYFFEQKEEHPKIKFGLNVPLINAINWLSEIPKNFKDLFSKFNEIKNNWEQEAPHLFNVVFGSKENFFQFSNNYLFNFANFYYDNFNFVAIKSLLEDILKKPSEIIDVIKKIQNGEDVLYKNNLLPKNNYNERKINKNLSGSTDSINLLKENLNLNLMEFQKSEFKEKNKIWKPEIFENLDVINEWNIWNDIILPIILKQNLTISYIDSYNNKKTNVVVYDGDKQIFNKIDLSPVNPGFDSPYSEIKIFDIKLGNSYEDSFLGVNTRINTKKGYEFLVNQSKKYGLFSVDETEFIDYNWNNKYIKTTDSGIVIKSSYLSSHKKIEESAWSTYKAQNQLTKQNDIKKIESTQQFMLIPDEAWGADESFDTNPNSTLQELFNDATKSKELYERAVVRPFINKKQITTEDLKEAKIKYLDFNNRELKIFTKENIGDFFLLRRFKDKNPNWDEIRFNELALMKKEDLIIDSDFQIQWFEKFIKNPNLANKTFKDFWPKYDEGRFFVVASYKPSIESTQIELNEKAGFWYAGTLKDKNNLITNINYVVELEVKNKTYTSKIQEFDINEQNYNNQIFSYSKYKQMMNQWALDATKFFAIDSVRFAPGQIQKPKINFQESLNNFVASGFGKIVIDYQKVLPIVTYVGNKIIQQQLPFDLNNVTGMNQFKNQYSKYIVENINQYNKLNELQKESKILLDNRNNKIIIGGKVVSELQNFNINGINQRAAIVIEDEYLDSKVAVYGFDQKTKKYTTLEEFQKEWASYTQIELFDKLFGNYNHNNKKEILKKVIQDYDVKFKVVITDAQFKVIYDYKPDPQSNNRITDDQTLSPLNLINIRPVKLNNLNRSSFAYGYDQQQDYNVPFNVLIENLKNKEILASHFNFENDFERNNFIDGIKTIEILENPTKNSIKIKITLNENFITYNENDSLIIDVAAKEFEKFDLGNLELSNINSEIKNKLVHLSDEEVIKYLNNLDLATKKSFFIGQTNEIKELTQINETNQPEENLKDIDFYFDGDKLVANVGLNKDWLLLAKNNKTSIDNFMYNLKVDLGIINPFKEKWMPVIIGIVTTVLSVGIAFLTWLIIKKHKRNQQLIGKTQAHKYEADPSNFVEDNDTSL